MEEEQKNGWWEHKLMVMAMLHKNAQDIEALENRFNDFVRFMFGLTAGAVVTMGIYILSTR